MRSQPAEFCGPPLPQNMHTHVCRACKTGWQHAPVRPWSEERNDQAHKCPGCGKFEYRIDRYLD